jgi:hypothetical protein
VIGVCQFQRMYALPAIDMVLDAERGKRMLDCCLWQCPQLHIQWAVRMQALRCM